MVHQQDGAVVDSLQFAQIPEQWRDLVGCVFIDTVQANEGVKDEQGRADVGNGLLQALLILRDIEEQPWSRDDEQRQLLDIDLGGRTDAFDALTHHRQRILGRKQQHRPCAPDWVPAQTGRSRSDTNGRIESQKALAAFGLSSQDANGLIGPEVFNEPFVPLLFLCQLAGALHRQPTHDLALRVDADLMSKTSKKSFSSMESASCCSAATSRSLAIFIKER